MRANSFTPGAGSYEGCEIRALTADRGDDRRRLDLVLLRHLSDIPDMSRSRIQAWIADGRIALNGRPVHRRAIRLRPGDIVSLIVPEVRERRVTSAEPLDLHVLHEDPYLMVLNKPPGRVAHPTYRQQHGTILSGLLWRARSWPPGQRPSLVHRLDKETSGVLIVAKTAAVHAALQRTMASLHSQKDYLALVYGRVRARRGAIALRLSRDPRDRRRVVASKTTGAESRTRFERLDQVRAPRAGLALLRCQLVTGRTHQIRVHLEARGWPIVGDPTYGHPQWASVIDPILAEQLKQFPRQALHAWRISMRHPVTNERVVYEAPLPDDLLHLLRTTGLDHLTFSALTTRYGEVSES